MPLRAAWLMLGFGAACSIVACKSHDKTDVSAAVSASATASAAPSASAPRTTPSAPASSNPAPRSTAQLPEGPALAIQAGKGVGPIRLGATVATIERLMAAPCELKTANLCRYVVRGVEFYLKGGVTERIVVNRHDRPAGHNAKGEPQVYGFFNGNIPPGAALGMIPSAVQKLIGKPTSSELVTTPNDFNTVARETYPGMVLEYDRYTNGNVILGGVVIEKQK
jgi:hypothetical protein